MDKITEAVARAICTEDSDPAYADETDIDGISPNWSYYKSSAIAAIAAYESEAKAHIAELEAALKPFAEVGADIADISTIAHDAPCVLKCENVSDFTLDASHFTQASDIYYEEKGANRSRKAYEGKL